MLKWARLAIGALSLVGYNAVYVGTAWAAFPVMSGPFTGAKTQVDRIYRDGISSSCAAGAKAYPGMFGGSDTQNYETASYTNAGPDRCVEFYFFTTSYGATPCATDAHLSIYNGSYSPLNQSANFLGDIGSSADGTMSINMTAGQTVVLVVTNIFGARVCDFAVEAQFDSGGGAVAKTTETIRNFMNRRADLITSSGPSSGNFHDRFEGVLFGEAGGVEPSAYKAAPAPSLRAMRGPVNDLGQAQRETIAVIEPLHPESERFASGGESGILNERISQMMSFSGGVCGRTRTCLLQHQSQAAGERICG